MNNILFKKIYLHNFLSFGNAEVTLNKEGYTLVTGINQNPSDLAKSNGSGKSAIFDAICWVLTGETIRGTKDIANIHGTDGAYVAIEFCLNGAEYRLLRSKDHKEYKTNLKIFINDVDKSGKGIRESEKLLEEYLPDVTPQLIGSVIIFGQGLPMRFSNNTPSGRKEVLEKLSKSDFMIEDLKCRLTKRKAYLGENLRTTQDNKLSYTSKVSVLTEQLNNAKKMLESMESPTSLQEELATLTTKKESLEADYSDTSTRKTALEESLQKMRDSYVEQNTKSTKCIEEIDTLNKPNLAKLIEQKNLLNSKIYSLTNEIKRLQNIKDICPTCGQKLPNVIKPDTSAQQEELNTCNAQLTSTANSIKNLEDNITEQKKNVKTMYTGILVDLQNQAEAVKTEIRTLDGAKTAHDRELSDIQTKINQIKTALNQMQIKKDTYTNTINECTTKIEEFTTQILYYTNEEDTYTKHLEVVEKFNTMIKRDFRGFLLKNVIEYIEIKSKQYSQQIFETDKISFFLEGNNININYDGKEYSCLSTGEKQKVDLIVQFALRDMLCKYLGFNSNILVLDEVFDGLDSVGCNKVVNLIATMNNINSIYIVTHRADLSIPMDNDLTIVKGPDGISSIM